MTDTGIHPPATSGPAAYSPPGTFLPGTAEFPEAGETYVDPVFGTTVTRLSNMLLQGLTHDSQIYARNGFWSADGALFVGMSNSSSVQEAATGQCIAKGIPGGGGWGSFDPVIPDIWYYRQGSSLRSFNVRTKADSLVKSFPGNLAGLGASIDWIDAGGRYFLVEYGGSLKVWDKQEDVIYSGGPSGSVGTGWAGISPDGEWLIVTDPMRSHKIDHQTKSVSTSGTAFWDLCGDHGDVLSASDGKTYLVTTECHSEAAVYAVDITIPAASGDQQRRDHKKLIDMDWPETATHYSAVSRGPMRDWCYVSFEAEDDLTGGMGAWREYKQEIVMANVISGEVRRLVHHRSRNIGDAYSYQPRPSTSWDGAKVAWVTNMGRTENYADLFYAGPWDEVSSTEYDENPGPAVTPSSIQFLPGVFSSLSAVLITLERSGFVTLDIYNSGGRKAAMLLNSPMSRGPHKLTFNTEGLPQGVYFGHLKTPWTSQTERILLLK